MSIESLCTYTGICKVCDTKRSLLVPNILNDYDYECIACIDKSVQQVFDDLAKVYREEDDIGIFHTEKQISPFRDNGCNTTNQHELNGSFATPSPQRKPFGKKRK